MTMMNKSFTKSPMRRQQQGAALLVALVLLVLMTLLGLSALRSGALEERMAGHTFDRGISFQAAESGLREAESAVEALPVADRTPTVGTACSSTNGMCGATSDGTEAWQSAASNAWKSATAVGTGSTALTPQYLIEYLGATYPCMPMTPGVGTDPNNCRRYRITARSNAGADRAAVVVQSIYATN